MILEITRSYVRLGIDSKTIRLRGGDEYIEALK